MATTEKYRLQYFLLKLWEGNGRGLTGINGKHSYRTQQATMWNLVTFSLCIIYPEKLGSHQIIIYL